MPEPPELGSTLSRLAKQPAHPKRRSGHVHPIHRPFPRHRTALIFDFINSVLVGAIVWNLVTWWYAIPSSSSHAIVGGLCGAVAAQTAEAQGHEPRTDVAAENARRKALKAAR